MDDRLSGIDTARTEYRITGRFRMKEKRHVVDTGFKNLAEAQKRLQDLERQSEREMAKKKRTVMNAGGGLGLSVECHSDYDLLELRIESRLVTRWV